MTVSGDLYYVNAIRDTTTAWPDWTLGIPEVPTAPPPGTTITPYLSISYQKEENMRGLYEVLVVNPKTEEIIGPLYVVAKDEQGALLKADLPKEIRSNPDKYDFCVDFKGQVRSKKETQRVKVVEGDVE